MSCNKKLKNLINKAIWKKTTYIKPHEYILEQERPILFSLIKKMIDELGYDKMFLKKEYRYLNFEGYKYWIVENVLNRQESKI